MPSKIKISIAVAFFAVLIASIIYQYKESPVNQIRQTISHEGTGTETDSLKRLETVSKSGSNWGMSPFGSGKPLIEEEKEPEVKFKQPNTDWPNRTINGVTYVFGEGNPREVELKKSDYSATETKDGIPYVTTTVEKNIKSFLADGRLGFIIEKCGAYLNTKKFEPSKNPFDTENLSINNLLYVDEKSRRKEVRIEILNNFSNLIMDLYNPLTGETDIAKKCLARSDSGLVLGFQEKLSEIGFEYTNTQGSTVQQE